MSTKNNLQSSRFRSLIETSFYGNTVVKVESLKEAYELAKHSPGTIVTDQDIREPEKFGLSKGSKVLVFNDGKVLERTGSARRDIKDEVLSYEEYCAEVREIIFKQRHRKMYHASVYIGTHRDFMVKANLLIPEGWESILYHWMLNFQEINQESLERYENSMRLKEEGDIFLLAFPDINGERFPSGLSLFEGESNVGAILGLNFFAEYKKGTLSLAWAIAERNNYIPVHGGQKKYYLKKEVGRTALFVGLTGSGKSVFMNHKHGDSLSEEILHDDALIISSDNGRGISMEPSYFDKTKDHSFSSDIYAHTLSAQNQGVTISDEGKKIIVGEDLRNDNGRVILSPDSYENRVYSMEESPDIIFWLMKDPVLPPVMKLASPELALAFGATLSNLKINNTDTDLIKESEPLTMQPFGNPFRTYPEARDYYRFRKLITQRNIECYVINTGFFMGLEIPKEVSISIVDKIISGDVNFTKWDGFTDVEVIEIMGYKVDFGDIKYKNYFKSRIQERITFLSKREKGKNEFSDFPDEGIQALEKLLYEIE